MKPTTLEELRAAVGRVLDARGEAHDGLTVTLDPTDTGRVAVHIRGCFSLAMWMPAADEAQAIDRAWRTVLLRLDDGRASAEREVARPPRVGDGLDHVGHQQETGERPEAT